MSFEDGFDARLRLWISDEDELLELKLITSASHSWVMARATFVFDTSERLHCSLATIERVPHWRDFRLEWVLSGKSHCYNGRAEIEPLVWNHVPEQELTATICLSYDLMRE